MIIIIISVILIFYFFSWNFHFIKRDAISFKEKKVFKRILFVIAHPDDECMFFGPTLTHFTQNESNLVYILCLSTGNYYKRGKQRSEELWKSCDKLGVRESNITLLRCDDLPDHPSVVWPSGFAGRIICHHAHSLDIDVIISFDSQGVSGHVNHVSIFGALERLLREERLPSNCEVYCLDSVNIARKYISALDIIFTGFSSNVFTADFDQWLRILKAMKEHRSQYTWFRFLYIFFSRYILMNTLTKVQK